MGREDKKEPISDLTRHNLKREEEVREATKRLDEYLVTKFDLNKPQSMKDETKEKIQKDKLKTPVAKEGEQMVKSVESKNNKKGEEEASETKASETKATEK